MRTGATTNEGTGPDAPRPRRRLTYVVVLLLVALPLIVAAQVPEVIGIVLRLSTRNTGVRVVHDANEIRSSAGVTLQIETVARDLDTPWDLKWGPDGDIWFTERPGRVSRLDLETGHVSRVGDINVTERGESGLMGMAFHPDFPETPYIYFAHSFGSRNAIRNRLIRATFHDGRITMPEVLLDDIPGRANHDGAALLIGPDRLLYMTMGDAGQQQSAQDTDALNGKIFRLTLDGRPAPDNPFHNHTWSFGHRNPQGLDFMPSTRRLYSAEHGPGEADEVNLIERARNYGWPVVRGECDTESERTFCQSNNVVPSLVHFTPTIGISGLAAYDADRIPGWKGSLLVTSLRGARLIRLTLTADGRAVSGQEDLLRGEYGRLRDVLVAPDGTVFIATSNRDGRGNPVLDDDRILRIRP